MRVVFMGTPELAVPTLAAVAERHEVAAVVCQPDRPQGRSKRPAPPPVKVWAESHGLPVHQPEKLNDGAFENWLRGLRPDAGVIAAYGRLLKQPILDIPRHGHLNMHPSLLPRHRGPSPIQAALLEGDTVTGVSIMRLCLDMDAGDILLQREEPILPEDNAVSLAQRLGKQGADMMAEALDLLETGRARFTPQDSSKATYCKLLTKEDGCIRWADPAVRIHNRVRACVPWPVAHCLFRGKTCRIHETCVEPAGDGADAAAGRPPPAEPGTIVRVEPDALLVATGGGPLAITVLQTPGKRAMTTAEYLRGHHVQPGERFEDRLPRAS